MAQGDMFLKLEGIDGESEDDKHSDEIEVLSFSWGGSNSGGSHTMAGSGVGKSDFQDISFAKSVDKATCDLIAAVAVGKHIDEAVLTVRKAGGDDPLEYLVYTFDDVYVSSYQVSGSGGNDLPMESFSLSYGKFNVKYQKQNEDGTGEPAGEVTYSLKKAKKD